MKKVKSIRFRITTLVLLINIITIVLLSTGNNLISINQLNDNFKTETKQSITLLNSNITDYITKKENDIINISMNSTTKNVMKGDAITDKLVMEEFTNYKKSHKEVLNVYISTVDKRMYISDSNEILLNKDYTSRQWYQDAISQKKPVLSNPYIDSVSKNLTVAVSTPLYDDKQNIIGVIGIDIDLDALNKQVLSQKIGDTGAFYVLDKEKKILIYPDKNLINKPVSDLSIDLKNAIDKNNNEMFNYKINKIEKMALQSTNEKTGWTIIGTMDKNEVKKDTNGILIFSIIFGIVILIFNIVSGIFFTGSITKPIKELSSVISEFGKGNLKVKAKIFSNDELGTLSENLNQGIDNLSVLVRDLQNISKDVNASADSLASISEETTTSSEDIAKTISEVANATSDQAEQTQIGAEKTNELAKIIESIYVAIENISTQFENTNKLSDKGLNTVRVLTEKSKENAEVSKTVSEIVIDFDKSSKEIGSIVSTIQNIAEQTNLLSLNASIESARAGEYGRGFSVVAQEIRKLAEQSANATNQIKKIIEGIQGQSNEAVKRIGKAMNIGQEQDKAVKETEGIFNEISGSIKSTKDDLTSINELTENMVEKKEKITSVMENISASSEQTSASTQEISASTEEQLATFEEISRTAEQLSLLTEKLNEEIKKFNV